MHNRVLIVDDSRTTSAMVADLLRDDYEIREVANGKDCLAAVGEFRPELVLLDVMLPDMDGFSICRWIKSQPSSDYPQVIMVTAKTKMADRLAGYEAGADDYLTKPFEPHELLAKVRVHMRLRSALQRAQSAETKLNTYNGELERLVDARTSAVQATQDIAVFSMAKLADSRDPETGKHLERMRHYSQVLAEQLQRQGSFASEIDDQFLSDLYRSSPLHDIGKVGIADSVLRKPGRLTEEEFKQMQEHAVIGAETLESASLICASGGFLDMAAQIARYHHEKWDGSGYPEGLKREEIPLSARIVALADAFDAITSERVYKPAYPPEQALQIIEEDSGRHFDPTVVDAFCARYEELAQMVRSAEDVPSVRPQETKKLPRWRVGMERGLLPQQETQQVLIVDSDPATAKSISGCLNEAGYEVQEANDLPTAKWRLETDCPQYVITDWRLPGGGDGELCQWIRRQHLPDYVYTIVAADGAYKENIGEMLDSGADDFLTKPLRPDEVLARLRTAARVVQLQGALSSVARTDPLTGMATRRLADDQMRREWERAVHYRLPLSCAVVEIDGFDEIEQRYGQETGDQVIKTVADVISGSCRVTAFPCRYGKAQFLVLLPESHERDAATWSQRMRGEAASRPIEAGDRQLRITVNVGVAQRMADTTCLDALIRLAEQAQAASRQLEGDATIRYGSLGDAETLAAAPQRIGVDPMVDVVAGDVMTSTITSLHYTDTARDASRFLLRYRINSAPVVDDEGNLVGVMSEKDLICNTFSIQFWDRPIETSMTREVITFDVTTPLRNVYEFLCDSAIRRAIVVDGGKPVGVISRAALLRWYNSWGDAGESDAPAESAAELATDESSIPLVKQGVE